MPEDFSLLKSTISIHALRVEGDEHGCMRFKDLQAFLSTPSGWRATYYDGTKLLSLKFLSTPSGWRATYQKQIKQTAIGFLSTPSGWRATIRRQLIIDYWTISIHALRVEGDSKNRQSFRLFLRKREKNLPL